ncbi:exported hypothetical protein [Candidatus Zixiibacteriota bacterium]|nr:exported hypothetical protein [candidate division Zixibacteria bacterium]
MKTSLLLLVTLISVNVLGADSNWHQIPAGTGGILNSVFFCDQDRGMAVTSDGLIIKFFDKGKVSFDTLQQNLPLQGIFFLPGCEKGFICGAKGSLFRTTDGGQTWSRQQFDSSYWFFDISFSDSLHGLLIGSNVHSEYSMAGVAFITSDGGITWDSVAIKGRQLDNIDISPEGITAVTGAGRIFISRDRGKTWEEHNSPEGGAVRAAAIRGNIGLMVGMNGYVALSDDTGHTWQKYLVLSEDKHLLDLVMVDAKRMYAGGGDGVILYSDDSGRDWIPEASTTNGELMEMRKIGNRLYACGSSGILIYKDLGKK